LQDHCCSDAWPRRRSFLISYLVGAVLIYGTLAFSPPLGVAIVAAIAAGTAFGPVNPVFATVTQENTPPYLLGRVSGRSPLSCSRRSRSERYLPE